MAEKKDYRTDNKSFMLYKDWERYFEALGSDEDAGRLVKALFAYVKRGETAEFEGALGMAFLMMSDQLARDGEKWEESCAKRAKSGSLGGKAKAENAKKNLANGSIATNATNCLANLADTDTDKDKDKDKETDIDKDIDTETGKDTEPCGDHFPAPAPAKANNNINLSEEARRSLCDKYGSELVDEYITRVLDYCNNTGRRYSDPASTIAKWIEQDKAKGSLPEKKPAGDSFGLGHRSYDIDEWVRTADEQLDNYMRSLGVI